MSPFLEELIEVIDSSSRSGIRKADAVKPIAGSSSPDQFASIGSNMARQDFASSRRLWVTLIPLTLVRARPLGHPKLLTPLELP